VFEENMSLTLLILDGKELDIDMMGAFGRVASIYNFDGRLVVFIEGGRSGKGFVEGGNGEVTKDHLKVCSNFGGSDGSNECGFSGTGGGDDLSFGAVGNDSTSEDESITSGGTS
jgi:hypothetical protein